MLITSSSFYLQLRNSIRGFDHPSVCWSIHWSVHLSVHPSELIKKWENNRFFSLFAYVWVCVDCGGGLCKWELDVRAHTFIIFFFIVFFFIIVFFFAVFFFSDASSAHRISNFSIRRSVHPSVCLSVQPSVHPSVTPLLISRR